MAYTPDRCLDAYIDGLADWQRAIFREVRDCTPLAAGEPVVRGTWVPVCATQVPRALAHRALVCCSRVDRQGFVSRAFRAQCLVAQQRPDPALAARRGVALVEGEMEDLGAPTRAAGELVAGYAKRRDATRAAPLKGLV